MIRATVFDDRDCLLGENPHYDERTGRVMWVDIGSKRLLWRVLATGEVGEVVLPQKVTAAVPRENGGLAMCVTDGVMLVDAEGGVDAVERFPDDITGDLRANDAKADPRGRLWVGTMSATRQGAGALYRMDPGATPVKVLDGVTVSNGLGWSPDAALMYYIDSATHRIDVLAEDRRTFVEIDAADGKPDGMCVDAEGGVWVACWGGGAVRRYGPDGVLDRIVTVPAPNVTSCAFAGPQLDLLIITAVGCTHAYRPGDVVGMPVDRFAG